jgi:divalent metal cation (Fe/Co/Zn/Cd) transporter
VVAFPVLAAVKRRIGRSLGSAVVMSDANKTQLYGWLCLAVLMGSELNLWLGWWWADPIAGLAVAAPAVREGAQDWREAAEIDDRNRGE